MARIAIVTDSTSYLSADLVASYKIRVVPLKIHWKGVTYLDGIDITPAEFYPRLEKEEEIPTTSQPPTQEFQSIFEELAKDHDGIVVPLISSGISGTVDSARTAAAHFSTVPVEVIDSRTTSGGLALVVLAAARAAEAGGSLEEVAATARKVVDGLCLFSMVDTLKYLHLGGRIGGAARYFGSALDIKPILYFNAEGKLDALERVRTRSKALDRVVERAVRHAASLPAHVAVFHSNAPESAEIVRRRALERINCLEILILDLSPVIGIHVGPGIAGLTLYTD